MLSHPKPSTLKNLNNPKQPHPNRGGSLSVFSFSARSPRNALWTRRALRFDVFFVEEWGEKNLRKSFSVYEATRKFLFRKRFSHVMGNVIFYFFGGKSFLLCVLLFL